MYAGKDAVETLAFWMLWSSNVVAATFWAKKKLLLRAVMPTIPLRNTRLPLLSPCGAVVVTTPTEACVMPEMLRVGFVMYAP